VGDTVTVHPTAVVEPGAKVGHGTNIWHFAHVREGAVIGPGCNIGKDVYVDSGALIGALVKVQNGVSVYCGVTLEDEVFVGPHVCFTNDVRPRSQGEWTLVPTFVRRGASIGAGATIVCGVEVGPHAMVAAGAVVTCNVPPYGLVRGNPARLVGYVCRRGHTMEWAGAERISRGSGAEIEELRDQTVWICAPCGERLHISYKVERA
jgi:UDP-2-acetamido-3-amino-2,3-dideoxy-glucuronate N-acetyltransferase